MLIPPFQSMARDVEAAHKAAEEAAGATAQGAGDSRQQDDVRWEVP